MRHGGISGHFVTAGDTPWDGHFAGFGGISGHLMRHGGISGHFVTAGETPCDGHFTGIGMEAFPDISLPLARLPVTDISLALGMGHWTHWALSFTGWGITPAGDSLCGHFIGIGHGGISGHFVTAGETPCDGHFIGIGHGGISDISLLLGILPVTDISLALGMGAFPDISSLPGTLPGPDISLAWGASPDNSWIQSKRDIWINPVVSLEWVLTGFLSSLPDRIPEAYLDESLYPDIRTYQVP